MARDVHLETGEYEPQRYWDARAEASNGDVYRAVGDFSCSPTENAAMERIQLAVLDDLLAGIALEGQKVLEFGCGVGRLAPFFMDRGAHYTGYDISRRMLDLARSCVPAGSFELVNTGRLPADDAAFDLVLSVTVLHHNAHEAQEEILGEMARVTRSGGQILLLEGVVPPGGAKLSFNMFPRTVDGWQNVLPNRVVARRVRLARWWLTRDLLRYLSRRLLPGRRRVRSDVRQTETRPRCLPGEKLALRLGSWLDPYLVRLLPRRYATNAGILFRRL